MAIPEQVASRVYRVDAVGLSNAISVLLVEDGDGWSLVDTGLGSSAERIREALSALGAGPEDLRSIFLTHHHPDHVGSLPNIQKWASKAEVIAPEREAEIISGRRERDPSSNVILGYLSRYQKLPTASVDRIAREGDVIAGFRVVLTPGHTLGHASLLRDEDGILFTGDAFGSLLRRIRVGGLKALCADPPQARRSAEKLIEEQFDTVVMSHGKPLYAGAQQQLREAVARCNYT